MVAASCVTSYVLLERVEIIDIQSTNTGITCSYMLFHAMFAVTG
ncbi:hypothetical protein BIFGAL_04248 [Bifidobacterium gallicum DSM 20093 = LMG 11596]|uniref:Uncharacterized protein n=1 Tax=Bifidobacterium gallicum DSM 20093 = LMG 11596 TaxID=561180 RepID=D1NWJ4_9BIFI|nr:hypothetical protein BIFGAL_04248 [Bifidobacterium gallicum DSM 20093 = LMG 11596]